MKCLWLTFHDPSPAINGQYLYSEGLIRSVAEAGIEVDVVAIARPDGRHRDGDRSGSVRWHVVGRERAKWTKPFSRLPLVAVRSATSEMRRVIGTLLRRNRHDVVVFDSICVGWAAHLRAMRGDGEWRPLLVHVAHNHEITVARLMAAQESGFGRRLLLAWDVMKVAWLESSLVKASDISTSNTPDDLAKFQAQQPAKRIALLPPGYAGPFREMRVIGPAVPRRAAVVGSFNWPPKRRSLEDFLNVAAELFREREIELEIVGWAEDSYLADLKSRFPSVSFTGQVADVYRHISEARIAVVPDYLGGFKLKSLDYVFNRLPIFALAGSVPGVPLIDGESVRLFADHASLARGIVDHIDSFTLLNRQHEAAFAACKDGYDWSRIGAKLVELMQRPTGTPAPSARREPVAAQA